jgi:hypothetical protein
MQLTYTDRIRLQDEPVESAPDLDAAETHSAVEAPAAEQVLHRPMLHSTHLTRTRPQWLSNYGMPPNHTIVIRCTVHLPHCVGQPGRLLGATHFFDSWRRSIHEVWRLASWHDACR